MYVSYFRGTMAKKGKSSVDRKLSKPMFKFRCVDGEIVHVDLRCFYESERVHDYLKEIDRRRGIKDRQTNCKYIDDRNIGYFPIGVQIPSHIVSMVNHFCISRFDIYNKYARHGDHCLSNMLEDFNCSFLKKKPLTVLVQLMNAAIEMRIKSLLNLTRNAIVDMLDGKSADEIPKIFNMPDFNHEACKYFYVSKTWTVEQMIYPKR